MIENVVRKFLDATPYTTPDGRVLSGDDVVEFVELFFGAPMTDNWYAGHVDADSGDHEMYLEDGVCGCCGVDFTVREN